MEPPRFSTRSLRESPHGELIQRVLQAAIRAVDPAKAVKRHLIREGHFLSAGGQTWDLRRFEHVWLVGAGKAGAPMTATALDILDDAVTGGAIIVKEGYLGEEPIPGQVKIYEAGHPLPDQRGLAATAEVIQILKQAGEDDLVVCLLSGGGSALLCAPVEGVSLADLQQTTAALLACGASIDEINTLRKHLDRVKGGGLARLASPARVLTLILSDVVGDPLDVIASGPTVGDPTTFQDALDILARYQLADRVPGAVLFHLEKGNKGQVEETPKPHADLFQNVYHQIVGNNAQAALAGLAEAQAAGLHTLLLTTYLQGEARQMGRSLAAIARQLGASDFPIPRPACIVMGGETTVTVRGKGLGGRNQEVALGAVADMAGVKDVFLITLATDGGDGPTDAAGAVVTGRTLERARKMGMIPQAYLENNDAYHFFDPLGDLLKPGPTHTNVNDLSFLFAF